MRCARLLLGASQVSLVFGSRPRLMLQDRVAVMIVFRGGEAGGGVGMNSSPARIWRLGILTRGHDRLHCACGPR